MTRKRFGDNLRAPAALWCLGTILLLAVAVAGGSLLDWLAAAVAVLGVGIFWLLIKDEARRRS